jgi:hypothetical protein
MAGMEKGIFQADEYQPTANLRHFGCWKTFAHRRQISVAKLIAMFATE